MDEKTKEITDEFMQELPAYFARIHEARMRGEYVLGKTGTGKTSYLLNTIVGDIFDNRGVIVIDPKGDLITDVLRYVPPERRDDVRLLDVTNQERIFGFNYFDLPPTASNRERHTAVMQVMEVFGRIWGDLFREIPVIADVLLNACHIIAANPGYTLADMLDIIDDDALRTHLLQNVTNPIIRNFWEKEWTHRDKWEYTRTTRPRIRAFLVDDLLMGIVGQAHSTVDFARWMEEQRIVLIRIPWRWFGEYQTTLLGTLLLHSINKAIEPRLSLPYEERKNSLLPIYIDEYHRVMNKDTADILTEGRGYGIAIVLAHQTRSQLEHDAVQLGATLQAGKTACFQLTPPDADEMAGIFDHTPPEPEATLAPDAWAALGTRGHRNPQVMDDYRHAQENLEICYHGIRTGSSIDSFTLEIHHHAAYYTGNQRTAAEEACRQLDRVISHYLTQAMHRKANPLDADGLNAELLAIYKKHIAPSEGSDPDKTYYLALFRARDYLRMLAIGLQKEPITIHTDPQRTYQDMQNEIANMLTNLPQFTCRIRFPDGKELTYTTQRLEAVVDDSFRYDWTPDVTGYTRTRAEIDREIADRQQWHVSEEPLPQLTASHQQRRERKPLWDDA